VVTTAVATKLSKYSFVVLGVVLGIIVGIYIKSIVPQSTITFDYTEKNITSTSFWSFLSNSGTLLALILGFFFFELLLAILLNKPHMVWRITLGLLVIPWVWGAIADYPYTTPSIWGKLGMYALLSTLNFAPMMFVWLVTLFISLSIPYLVAIDTSAMEDETLLPQAFCFNCEFTKESSSDFVDITADRMGFTKTRTEDSDIVKLSYYSKGSLKMSVLQKTEKDVTRIVFGFYTINEDTVKKYENPEEIEDYKSLLKAFIALRTPIQILSSTESTPSLLDLKQMGEGLCRRTLPAKDQIRSLSRDFPKNHPQWFSLILLIIGGAIVEIVRTFLSP